MNRADMMGGLADMTLPPAEQEPGEFEHRWNVAPDRRMPVAEAYQMGQLAGMDAYNEVDPLTAYGGYDKRRAALQRLEEAPDLGGPLIPSGSQISAGHPAVNRAVDVASELGAGVVIPQSLSPLDIGLAVAGGPAGGKLLRGGAAALGALFEPDTAEAGAISKIGKVLGGKPGGPHPGGIHVYHSSPHDLDRFDWSKLRTGEGGNTYGAGFYFAENPKVSGQGGQYWNQFLNRFSGDEMGAADRLRAANFDRERAAAAAAADIERIKAAAKHPSSVAQAINPDLRPGYLEYLQSQYDLLKSGKPVGPRTYEVNINARPELMLDWDKPVSAQSPHVQQVMRDLGVPETIKNYYLGPDARPTTGEQAYQALGIKYRQPNRGHEDATIASQALAEAGIPGIRYLDRGSRPNIHNVVLEKQIAALEKQPQTNFTRSLIEKHRAEQAAAPPPTYNYAVTDPSRLDILAKYGIVGGAPVGMGALAAQDMSEAEAAGRPRAARGMGSVLRPGAEVGTVENWRPPIGHNNPPPDVPAPTGSLNPLDDVDVTFRGKQPKDMSPEEMQAFGEHYGVKNLGMLSPLQTFKDMHGREFQIPGGTEGKWTYYDTIWMKANPINPAQVDRGLHAEMQRKLGRTHTPDELTDAQVFNGLVFGMTSPNNPLFPNQVSASRLRLRTPQMIDDLASMIPWKPGDEVPAATRKLANDAIAARFGLQSGEKGGLGTRGTADYSRIGEMAQMFRENPAFFRKGENESWGQAVERIASQVPGLSMKTGSFGTVWQDPANAAISAIDRHMARELDKRGGIFANPAERTDWENRSVGLWNKREADRVAEQTEKNVKAMAKGKMVREVAPVDAATDFDDLLKKSGSDGFMGEMLLDHVGKELTPQFRLATGEINPNIPQHLQQAQWVREPETVFKMGRAYKQALDVNQKIADENGLNLFMSQWMEWDRIRNRFEPHENMFPGLEKLPAPSLRQLREVDLAHKETGHKTYGKSDEGTLQPTRPLSGLPSRMGYLGITGAAAVPAMGQLVAPETYEAR